MQGNFFFACCLAPKDLSPLLPQETLHALMRVAAEQILLKIFDVLSQFFLQTLKAS